MFCQCGCGQKTVIAKVNDRSKGWIKGQPLKFIKGHNFKEGKRGEAHPHWKGGRNVTGHGYVQIRLAGGGRQYEHILVAERALGRKLRFFGVGHPDNEVVHHVDGNKQNNSGSNLLICTHQYHTELHHRLEQSPAWPGFKKVIRNSKGRISR